MRARPAWRGSADPAFLADHVQYNRWFMNEAHRLTPPVELYDTTNRSVEETAAYVRSWVCHKL